VFAGWLASKAGTLPPQHPLLHLSEVLRLPSLGMAGKQPFPTKNLSLSNSLTFHFEIKIATILREEGCEETCLVFPDWNSET
jgi:hypothetical protein